jgi:hypoxanthine-DNA glycosylase
MFFYGHPQNRFWRVISAVFECDVPKTVEEKREMLLSHGVALWDVLASCEIEGSADSTIKNAEANDLSPIFSAAKIEKVFVNGRTAEKYYNKYLKEKLGREAVCLPSTSPANAAWSQGRLAEAWMVIKK